VRYTLGPLLAARLAIDGLQLPVVVSLRQVVDAHHGAGYLWGRLWCRDVPDDKVDLVNLDSPANLVMTTGEVDTIHFESVSRKATPTGSYFVNAAFFVERGTRIRR
jgi:hypothetical protein